MTTTAATTPTMAHITLATTDPLAATESFNLLEDSFAHFLRTSRNSRPLSATNAAPTGLSPRVYGLSPRLPSALPPSASPRFVEPVTPDRQQPVRPIPYCSTDDVVDLPSSDETERAHEKERRRRMDLINSLPPWTGPPATGVEFVDEKATEELFAKLPRCAPAPPLIQMSAPEPRQFNEEKRGDPMTLSLPLELPPLRNPPSQTAPLPWESERIGIKTSPSPFAAWGKEVSPLGPERPDLQLPTMADMPMGGAAFMPRNVNKGSPVPPSISTFVDQKSCVSGPTSSISDAESGVTEKRPPVRPDQQMVDDHPRKKPVHRRAPPPPRQSVGGVVVDPLRCHICGQRFARRSNLFKHLRSVHEETRKFACTACSFKFKRQDHLIKHIRSVHAKLRKFSCDICGIGFAEKFNRDKHRRSIHETKRAFQCPCGAYFQDRDKMQNCLRCKLQGGPTF